MIKEEFILKKNSTIVKNSEEKSEFVENFIRKFRSIDIANITDKLSPESIVQEYADIAKSTWILHS